MKKIAIVVADGCVECIFTDITEEVEVEIVDFDVYFDSQDKQEAIGNYVDQLRATMKEL